MLDVFYDHKVWVVQKMCMTLDNNTTDPRGASANCAAAE
jgi:hypothetical protein